MKKISNTEDQPLWAWLLRPSNWSATQRMALATLLCFAAALVAVGIGVLFAAKALVVLAYVFLGLAVGREIIRTFRREQQ